MPVVQATEEIQAQLPAQPSKRYHTALGFFKTIAAPNGVKIVEESWPL